MSCSFWLKRKKLAALKRKQAETAATVVENATVETVTEKKETEKAVEKKPAKKAVQKPLDSIDK